MDPTEEEAVPPNRTEEGIREVTTKDKKCHRRSRSFNEVFGVKKFPQIVIGRRTNSPDEEGGEVELDCDLEEGPRQTSKGSLTHRGGGSSMPPLPPNRGRVAKKEGEEVEEEVGDDKLPCEEVVQQDEQVSEMEPVEGDENKGGNEGEKKEGEGEGSSEEQLASSLKGSAEGNGAVSNEQELLELLRKNMTGFSFFLSFFSFFFSFFLSFFLFLSNPYYFFLSSTHPSYHQMNSLFKFEA